MKKYLLFILCFFFSLNAMADNAASNQLSNLLTNLQTMRANFNQTITDSHGNVIQESSGTMALKRPGLFRWETNKPNQQLIVADGKNIWIYDKDLMQVIKQNQNANNNAPGLLLSASINQLTKRFTVHPLTTDDQSEAFTLSPTKKDLFKSVELVFSTNHQLQQMNLNDNLGQKTEIVFTQVTYNSTLPSNLFQFQVPKDVDVVNG